jgi:hypothetical protein
MPRQSQQTQPLFEQTLPLPVPLQHQSLQWLPLFLLMML